MRNSMSPTRISAVVRLFFSLAFLASTGMAQGPAEQAHPATSPVQLPQGGIRRTSPGDIQGSVAPEGAAASAVSIALSLQDAIDRGLKNNLGMLVNDSAS